MDNKEFKPYIPADKVLPELTVTSIILGLILSVVFGAANAYLGLRVGMTISASIPAAVISMGIIRVIMKRNSILENNMVQTIGSAGESLAAGAIFTIPALFMWANESTKVAAPSFWNIAIISLFGGILGVLFMIPLRNALIVKEHGVLPFPEGTACAEVLLAGEEGGHKTKIVFSGLGIAALYKFITDGIKEVFDDICKKINLPSEISAESLYKALITRESRLSTAVGNGISIPHAQQPILKDFYNQRIYVCYLKNPIEMHALDNKKIKVMIVILTSSVKSHLHIISTEGRCFYGKITSNRNSEATRQNQILAQ